MEKKRRKFLTPKQELELEEIRLANMRRLEMKEALKAVPRGITLNQLKCGYIEHVLEVNEGNRSRSAKELNINYTSFVNFLNGSGLEVTPVKRGRPALKPAILEA
jgi:hypothetical protein